MGEELWFGLGQVEINDSHFFNEKRKGEYVNVIDKKHFTNRRDAYDFSEVEIKNDDVIFIRNMMWTNEGQQSTRIKTHFIDEISAVGGLYYPFLGMGIVLSFLFVDPFRLIDLSIAFSKLKNNICD